MELHPRQPPIHDLQVCGMGHALSAKNSRIPPPTRMALESAPSVFPAYALLVIDVEGDGMGQDDLSSFSRERGSPFSSCALRRPGV